MPVRRLARHGSLAAAVVVASAGGVASPGDAHASPMAVYGGAVKAQHATNRGHLEARNENFELVSKVELTGRFGNVVPEQIADVVVHKGFAYLSSWNEPTCTRGGTYVVDIRDPAAPKEIGFLPAPARSIHGEGADVVSFKGRDILAANNEPCLFATQQNPGGPGGFDLWDVTNPAQPVKLGAAGAPTGGDTGPEGALTGNAAPHSTHSTVLWEHGDRLFIMTVDNVEAHDVDIHDITDPGKPAPVAEYDLLETFPQIQDSGDIGSFAGTFHHDTTVKQIDGRPVALISYWDGGYVTVDIADPRAPKYIGDSSFAGPDPLSGELLPPPATPLTPPEGNAHYAEFSHDNRFILAADEDVTPHRAGTLTVEGAQHEAAGAGGALPPAALPDRILNGPTVYGGYGCNASLATDPIPRRSSVNLQVNTNEEAILVLQLGPTGDSNNPEPACLPGEKAANAWDAGWQNVVFVNRHLGSANADEPFCGGGRYVAGKIPVAVCATHAAAHDIFDTTPGYGAPYNDEANHPAPIGTLGDEVSASSQFDGWGYAHLYRNTAGKLERLDSYAVAEALDERYSVNFGDLSIHEHATDETENLSYVAYYSAGMRAISFDETSGITEIGSFIDKGGSNFWGVEQFTAREEIYTNPRYHEERLIAASDRDFGLYLFRFTGPGAAKPPVCADSTVTVPFKASVTVPLTCADPNGNPIIRSLLSNPINGTVSAVSQGAGTVIYTHTGNRLGVVESLTIRAADPAARSNRASVTVIAVPRRGVRCLNPFTGSRAANNIAGSPFGDIIRGGGGDDIIQGRAQSDCVFGERGDDLLWGQLGRDTVDGGAGEDRMWGDSNSDTLRGRSGADELHGGSGDDRLDAGDGDDQLEGADHDDQMLGGDGRDDITGGSGDDRLVGGDGADDLNGGPGANRYAGGAGNDDIRAVNERRDSIACGRGVDDVEADRRDRVARDCERVSRPRRRAGR